MKSGLLTADELVQVTGLHRGADQMRVLREQGYHPLPGFGGHPAITWEALHARMAGLEQAGPPAAANDKLLDWTALRRRA